MALAPDVAPRRHSWPSLLILLLAIPLLLCILQLGVGMQSLSTSVHDTVATTTSVTAEQKLLQALLSFLARTRHRYIIVDAKNGLGNRLRALASAMSVAQSLGRRVLLVWVPDLHLNCSFPALFDGPLPFDLFEQPFPLDVLPPSQFQVFNYMRPEPGAIKDEPIDPVSVPSHLCMHMHLHVHGRV